MSVASAPGRAWLPAHRQPGAHRGPVVLAGARGADAAGVASLRALRRRHRSVVVGALPILTGVGARRARSRCWPASIRPADAWAGFANGTILLIVIAFLVARAVVKCGLGERIGHAVVGRFGRSTLGLGYSLFLVDAVIAPAFPSNTARSGVLYPLAASLAETAGAKRGDPVARGSAGFLMFSGIASLSLSSALWLTAMAANPLGTEIARKLRRRDRVRNVAARGLGADARGDGSCCRSLLYKVMAPEVTSTPDAPAAARAALDGARPAHARGVDRHRHLRRDGGAVGFGVGAGRRCDGGGVPRPRASS